MICRKDVSEDRAAQSDSRAEMAQRLRDLREARGLTIQTVADRAGIAISTVSKIERNLMVPTYDRFVRLARALEVELADLFGEGGRKFEPGGLVIARHGDTVAMETEGNRFDVLFPGVAHITMTPMICTLTPLAQMDGVSPAGHPGEEFLLVLEGQALVRLDGVEDVILGAGDSLYFDSVRPHFYAGLGDTAARVLIVGANLEHHRLSAVRAGAQDRDGGQGGGQDEGTRG
ncbi:helix-turn-helix domain-containing protein [Pseudooceanicola aestuarii]|uniref:helix-turn-helix domain-containing protein n=1 Tax=Pseudooceanicola aestuarii TaxID=2697319 RepID=UPI001EF999C3|nr:XRE family transcriptional regulator [Pseudooceanicola aestuarii]